MLPHPSISLQYAPKSMLNISAAGGVRVPAVGALNCILGILIEGNTGAFIFIFSGAFIATGSLVTDLGVIPAPTLRLTIGSGSRPKLRRP